MAKGNFGILMVRHLDFTVRTLRNFWISIAAHLHGTEEFCRHIPMLTIANMFTDSKEWNNELVRDFIDKWYK